MSTDNLQWALDRIEQLTQRGAELTAQRDAALAELAALKKRLADAPIGVVDFYGRVTVKLTESFNEGDVVRVVRVLAEDTK